MNKPKPGLARRPRDLEKFLFALVDEVNGIKAEQGPMSLFLSKVKAKAAAKAKAKVEAETKKKAEAKAKAEAEAERKNTDEVKKD